MGRLDKERQNELEPDRLIYAKAEIEKLGYEVAIQPGGKSLKFIFNGHIVTHFPYSGWHTGNGIKDGRGIKHLLEQINKTKNHIS